MDPNRVVVKPQKKPRKKSERKIKLQEKVCEIIRI